MDQRPWWERLFDRDSPAGPWIVLALLVLAIGLVLTLGPLLDRLIEGPKPASYLPGQPTTLFIGQHGSSAAIPAPPEHLRARPRPGKAGA